MKKIGVDAHVLTGKYQGSRTYLHNMLEHIGRIDRDNEYIVYSFDPRRTRSMLPEAPFEHRAIPAIPSSARLACYWPYVQLRDRLDLLLTQYICPPFLSRRQIVVVHDTLVHSHPEFFPFSFGLRTRLLGRRSARRARAVFVVSQTGRRDVLKYYGIDPAKVHLTRNGIASNRPGDKIDVGQAERLGRYILTVGRIEPRKNIGMLVRAFRALGRPDLSLVIVGTEENSQGDLLREIAATPRAVHLRNVGDAALRGLYRNAALFVYPSLAEGFGFPLLEALANHLPIISSDRMSMPEVAGPFATYFNPGSPVAEHRLATLMADLLDAPAVDRLANIDRHLAQFDWNISARTFVNAVNAL